MLSPLATDMAPKDSAYAPVAIPIPRAFVSIDRVSRLGKWLRNFQAMLPLSVDQVIVSG